MVIIFGFYFFHQQATSTATATVQQSVRLYANEAANAVAETENAGKYETLEPGANLTDRPMATCCHRFLAISDKRVIRSRQSAVGKPEQSRPTMAVYNQHQHYQPVKRLAKVPST